MLPPGGTVEQPWLSVADVDGDGKPELLATQKNLRAVVLKPEAVMKDRQQTGVGVSRRSRSMAREQFPPDRCLLCRAAMNAVPSLFLLDAERKALTLCERDAARGPAGRAESAVTGVGLQQPAKRSRVGRWGPEQCGVPWDQFRRPDGADGETWEFSVLDGL